VEIQGLGAFLTEHAFFAGLPESFVGFVAGCGRNVSVGTGDYLFREGEDADRMFVVREGRVSIEVFVPQQGPVVIDTVGEGDIVGVSWLFAPHRWQFDARALDGVRAVALDGVCLRGKCDEDPSLGYEMMKRVSGVVQRRMQSARFRLLDLYGHGRAG